MKTRNVPGTTLVAKRCPTCRRSRYRGILWLNGIEIRCPDCNGTGTLRFHRESVAPPGVKIFMPGQTYPGTIIPVELESV